MKKFDVQIALEGVRDAKSQWARAVRTFNADVEKVLVRLLHEASANYMSPEEVARHSGLSPKRVRDLMRANGLNPRDGKRVLAASAAKALAENAELLGIRPHDMDLMSPLAYLPMGSQMKQALTDKAVARVTELPDDDLVFNDTLRSAMDYARAIETLEASGYAVTRVSGNKTSADHGYETIDEAVHDLHLRAGRIRPHALCPVCGLSGDGSQE